MPPVLNTTCLKKDGKGRRGSLSVRFADKSGSSLNSRNGSSLSMGEEAGSSSDMTVEEEGPWDDEVKQLDVLGHALENTFREVDGLDAYIARLRLDFEHDRLSEHSYFKGMCSARIAREACCRRQLETWRRLQHGIQELHQHFHSTEIPNSSTDCPCGTDDSSIGSHEDDVTLLLGQLRKMTTFETVVHRLVPGADAKLFIEQWIMYDHGQGHAKH